MIHTNRDLKKYLIADRNRYCQHFTLPFIIRWLINEEQTIIINYLKVLRYLEYFSNTSDRPINRLIAIILGIWHSRNCSKYKLYIPPNVVDKGLRIVHLGGRIELNAKSVGKNVTVTTGVILGKKGDNEKPTIEDNVELTLGSIVIGNVTIGENSIICQNSVVIKNVPSNSIASGVPISFIKPRLHKRSN